MALPFPDPGIPSVASAAYLPVFSIYIIFGYIRRNYGIIDKHRRVLLIKSKCGAIVAYTQHFLSRYDR